VKVRMRIASRVVVMAVVATTLLAMTDQPSEPGRQPAAAGWRWESYGGVEVQVPDDWDYGTTGAPSCLETAETAQRSRGYVGRPGPVPAIACPDPVPALEKRRAYLWFDSDAGDGVTAYDAGWVEQSRVVGDLALTVFTDDPALRTRILDSARRAPSDESCPVEHAVTSGPDARPDPGPGGLAALGPAESITLCRYALRDVGRPTLRGSDRSAAANPVLSAGELVGEQARAVVRAILEAPEGEGPNDPENCLPEYAYGNEVLLLRVSDGARTQEVFVRYSGCVGHGIDDGHTHRRLTSDALTPLLSGPHRPGVLQGSVGDLIWP
jgi:hypothetical protein